MPDITGDSAEAIALELLMTVARAEGVQLDKEKGGRSGRRLLGIRPDCLLDAAARFIPTCAPPPNHACVIARALSLAVPVCGVACRKPFAAAPSSDGPASRARERAAPPRVRDR